ncbi:hypothetical protein CVT24_005857 [Panaeolus cyanescens]|uniref:Uncharacterized protein n=1 Tax=Panaeolus cyanescens TaxID=181874 RepID=A0A409YEX1_9AGAR|nr:hypothetical protein CVT24_005857 [Panaeolus cyanescens]
MKSTLASSTTTNFDLSDSVVLIDIDENSSAIQCTNIKVDDDFVMVDSATTEFSAPVVDEDGFVVIGSAEVADNGNMQTQPTTFYPPNPLEKMTMSMNSPAFEMDIADVMMTEIKTKKRQHFATEVVDTPQKDLQPPDSPLIMPGYFSQSETVDMDENDIALTTSSFAHWDSQRDRSKKKFVNLTTQKLVMYSSQEALDSPLGLRVIAAECISEYQCNFKEFDVTCGKAVLLNGDLFYSPNSMRNVELPVIDSEPVSHILRNPLKDDVKEFLKPRWWDPQFTYQAFMPRFFDFDAPPFQPLFRYSTCFSQTARGFLMDPQDILAWNSLQHALETTFKQLQSRTGLPPQHIIIKSALCVEWHTSITSLREQIERSRDWFSVYAGVISFYIAYYLALCKDSPHEDCPTWFRDLAGKANPADQRFLDSLRRSDVGSFFSLNRVGTFVQLVDPPNQHPPSPEWFCAFGVPVWYPWGPKEAAYLKRDDDLGKKLKRLCPPPHLLQSASTFLCQEVKSGAAPVEDKPWEPFLADRAKRMKEALLHETNVQKQRRMTWEKNPPTGATTKVFVWQRSNGVYKRMRVDKADNLDTLRGFGSKQRVYNPVENEWDCCTKMGPLLEEERRDMVANDDYIASRSPSPSCDQPPLRPSLAGYDELHAEPLYNEFSGPAQPMAFTSPDVFLQSNPAPSLSQTNVATSPSASKQSQRNKTRPRASSPVHAVLTPEHQPVISMAKDIAPINLSYLAPEHQRVISIANDITPVNLLGQNDAHLQVPLDQYSTYSISLSGTYILEEHEIGEILFRYFGFQPPLPIPVDTPLLPLSEKDKTVFCKAVGFGTSIAGFFDTPYSTLTKRFFDSFAGEVYGPPSPDTWDFSPSSRIPLVTLPRLRHLRRVNDGFFVFDYGDSSVVAWRLAVFSAKDALMVCRLPDSLSQYEVLRVLIGRGVRCQTLLPYPSIPPSLPRVATKHSIRLHGYQWCMSDFEMYKSYARSLLNNPRIERAAVLAGGIVWRIALWLTASLGAVAENPTPAALALKEGFSFPRTGSPSWVGDDAFDTELDALCGLYLRFNHGSEEATLLSWFPLDSTWSSNFCYPFWTLEANEIFDKRLAEIESGNARPLTASEWRNKIRPASKARRAYKRIEAISLDFVKAVAH